MSTASEWRFVTTMPGANSSVELINMDLSHYAQLAEQSFGSIDMDNLEKRIQRGVKLLGLFPAMHGWEKRINLDILDIGSCTNCVLGQLFGNFNTLPGWVEAAIYHSANPFRSGGAYYGFAWESGWHEVPVLNEMWKTVIRARLEAQASGSQPGQVEGALQVNDVGVAVVAGLIPQESSLDRVVVTPGYVPESLTGRIMVTPGHVSGLPIDYYTATPRYSLARRVRDLWDSLRVTLDEVERFMDESVTQLQERSPGESRVESKDLLYQPGTRSPRDTTEVLWGGAIRIT